MLRLHAKQLYIGTTAERTALDLGDDGRGALFYDSDTDTFYLWRGSAWQEIGSGSGGDADHLVSPDGLIDPAVSVDNAGDVIVVGSIIMGSGESVDGVDLSAHAADVSAHHARYTDAEALVAVPDATTTTKGKVELATTAETQAGTVSTLAVTPAGIGTKAASNPTNHDRYTDAEALAAVPAASTTVKGKVELATDAETQTGTDTARAITPANLAAASASEATASRIAKRDANGYCKFQKVYLETLDAYTTPANVEYIHTKQAGATNIRQVTPTVLESAITAAVSKYRMYPLFSRITDTTNWYGASKTANTTFTITLTSSPWSLPSGIKAVLLRISGEWASISSGSYIYAQPYGYTGSPVIARGQVANVYVDVNGICPVVSDKISIVTGNVTCAVVYLEIWGYFI